MSNVYNDADEISELSYTTAYGKYQLGSNLTKHTNIGVPLRDEDLKMFKNTSFDANSAISADLKEAEGGIKRKVAQQNALREKITATENTFKKLKKIADKISQRGKDSLTPEELEYQKANPLKELNTKLAKYRKDADDLRAAVTKLREELVKIKKHMDNTFKVNMSVKLLTNHKLLNTQLNFIPGQKPKHGYQRKGRNNLANV